VRLPDAYSCKQAVPRPRGGATVLPMPRRARTRVTRRIEADPTSTVLLLAGPSAVDLWPGVRRTGEDRDRVLVAVPAPGGAGEEVRLAVRALPPLRTPTAYVTRFAWEGDDVAPVTARLTLAYRPTGTGTPATHAALELDVADDAPYGGPALAGMAEGFLENLARAAETRNRAA